MNRHVRDVLRNGLWLAACVGAVALGVDAARAQGGAWSSEDAAPTFTVDGRAALHAVMSLGDGHLMKTADVLALLAGTEEVRSAEWSRVRGPLAGAVRRTVPAVHWFAFPDGTYWTLERGREPASLSDRPYFPRVLDGETVVGELVVSRSSNRNTAIVAVPVTGPDGTVVGVLGSSVHLDSLSALVRRELGGLEEGLFFFAIDDEPLGALHSDSALIFTEPMELGDEGMRRAFTEILGNEEGTVDYTFRGSPRTVLYRRSSATGWWYGFGRVRPGASATVGRTPDATGGHARYTSSGSEDASTAPSAAEPTSRREVLENDRIRVIETVFTRDVDVPMHTHRFPHVLYVIEGGAVEITSADGETETLEVRPGQVFWREPQRHRTRDVGATPVRIVEVEVKDPFRRMEGESVPHAATPADLEWVRDPLDPTRHIALLAGDPTKPGPYSVRMRSDGGYTLGLHEHPTEDEHVTVLSGTLHWSTGEAGSGAPEHTAPAGSFVRFPAGTPHRLWITEPTVLQMTGVGPRTYHDPNPDVDPRREP